MNKIPSEVKWILKRHSRNDSAMCKQNLFLRCANTIPGHEVDLEEAQQETILLFAEDSMLINVSHLP